jgi:hypothetical protein
VSVEEPSDVLMWVLYAAFGIGFVFKYLTLFLESKPTSSAWQIPFTLETEEPEIAAINTGSSSGSDWDEICQAAIDKAKSGDTSARTWVTKHIYEQHEAPKPPKAPKAAKEVKEVKEKLPSLTSARVIEDTVMFLCCLGEKKRKVEPIIKDLGAKKKYENVESLVKDFYKRTS